MTQAGSLRAEPLLTCDSVACQSKLITEHSPYAKDIALLLLLPGLNIVLIDSIYMKTRNIINEEVFEEK